MQIYSLFEERGKVICKDIKARDANIVFGVDELKGKGSEIDPIRLFLEKQCGLTLAHWPEIDVLRKVRNSIVHSNGIVRDDDAKLRELVERTDGIELSSENQIWVTNAYVDHVFQKISETFRAIFDHMKYSGTFRIGSWPEHVEFAINPTTRDVIITS